jgi:glycosyltransferase involved in cell wall biosynthesis
MSLLLPTADAGVAVDPDASCGRRLYDPVVDAHPQPTQRAMPRVVLAHDWLVGLRGGEWVLDRLARLFGPTDLYTLVNDGQHLTDPIATCNVITSPLQKFPRAAGKWRRAYLPLMPWAVERLRVSPSVGRIPRHAPPHSGPLPREEGGEVQLLISTSSAVMKSIRPPLVNGRRVPHLCYCHSPARYIWEQTDEYAGGSGGRLRSLGLKAVRGRFQKWDRRTAQIDRVTQFIANSSHTAERIARCYGREAVVIHPPVRTEFYTTDQSVKREPWLLVVAALEPYKKTEMVIEAARRGGLALKVVGAGSQLQALQRQAADAPGIEFLGRIADEPLRDLYRRARALVFPQVEDFGIVAVEAQACGCAVIACRAGGSMDSLTERTGVFMREQTAEAVMQAIEALASRTIDPEACRANALRFSEARFDQQIMREAEALLSRDAQVASR